MNKGIVRKIRKEIKRKNCPLPENSKVVDERVKAKEIIKNNERIVPKFFYDLSFHNRCFYSLELLNYDIEHFHVKGNYMYLLRTIPFLYESLNYNTSCRQELYEKIQNTRMKLKKTLINGKIKEQSYKNYQIFKKILGKLEILSLKLVESIDQKYTENKTELVYYLIFSIKNIEVLKSLTSKNPHLINFLDPNAYKLLQSVISSYIKSLQNHVSKELNFFDDVIYYEQVLDTLLSHERNHLSVGDCRELAKTFEKALELYDGKNAERYRYFIQKWQLFFLREMNRNLQKQIPETKPVSLEELCYEYQIHKEFSYPILNESKVLWYQHRYVHHPKEVTKIYTIDGEGALELDDGFSCTKERDVFHLGIHISNPLEYLDPNHSLVFEEATRRTTSIYLHPEAITMYPDILAKDLFSLNAKTYRKVLSLYVDIDAKNFSVIDSKIKIECVYVAKNDTYSYANLTMETQLGEKDYVDTLNHLSELMPFLNRFFKMDDMYKMVNRKKANVSNTNVVGETKTKKIVESLMVFMNQYLANFALKNNLPFLYRNHEMNSLYKNDLEHYKQILLAEKNNDAYINEIDVLKEMYPKSYYSTENKGHFGLGISAYSHSTSPIRRIADDYNIFMIKEWLKENADDATWYRYELKLKDVADRINHERNALESFTKEYYAKGFHK